MLSIAGHGTSGKEKCGIVENVALSNSTLHLKYKGETHSVFYSLWRNDSKNKHFDAMINVASVDMALASMTNGWEFCIETEGATTGQIFELIKKFELRKNNMER